MTDAEREAAFAEYEAAKAAFNAAHRRLTAAKAVVDDIRRAEAIRQTEERRANHHARCARALALREAGMTYPEIGREMGFSASKAADLVSQGRWRRDGE